MSSSSNINGEGHVCQKNVIFNLVIYSLPFVFIDSILSTLSEANHILLKGFICILHRISEEADRNGMNAFNLGLCVSNSLFKTESTTITSGKQEADVMSSIIEFLIQNCSLLFGLDVLTCVTDKRIIVHQIPNISMTRNIHFIK
jgi:hypothetical protein